MVSALSSDEARVRAHYSSCSRPKATVSINDVRRLQQRNGSPSKRARGRLPRALVELDERPLLDEGGEEHRAGADEVENRGCVRVREQCAREGAVCA
eukprot:3589966-Pleurochrysis_carterae.AAC.1